MGAGAALPSNATYNEKYVQHRQRQKELLRGLRPLAAEMIQLEASDNGAEKSTVAIARSTGNASRKPESISSSTYSKGQGLVDASRGRFDGRLGAIGNIQKFPPASPRTASIGQPITPILGTPHPHPEYVAAIDRVRHCMATGADVKGAYDNLNKVMVERPSPFRRFLSTAG